MTNELEQLPEEKLRYLAQLMGRAKELEESKEAQEKFLTFVKKVWPDFIAGRHHSIMADKFEQIASGKLRRVIINMPPRHTKSEFASFLLPAWLIGRRPKLKIMQTTHTAELAFRFGRKVRTLMEGDEYRKVFQGVGLRADDKAAGRWSTVQGGEYFAAGVGGAVTGRGADLLIIDDPHSEQDALSPAALEHAYEWYTSGPRQRLQPGGSIVIVMTRWAENDLTGKLLRQQQKDILADKWEIVEFPALMPSGEPLWPEFWKKEELLAVKGSLSVGKWEAQWQQNPTSESSALLKREWWKKWTHPDPPKLSYILQAYDTAYGQKEVSDFSAITTWGVFYPNDGEAPNIILLDAQKGRWEFPELRRIAEKEYRYWKADCTIIEAKANGASLIQELRAMGIPVVGFAPSRGNDKVVRVNVVAPLFEAGLVWAPETRWAEEVIEECAAFPAGENDDYVDTVSLALRRFREGGFITHPEDWQDTTEVAPRQKVYYG